MRRLIWVLTLGALLAAKWAIPACASAPGYIGHFAPAWAQDGSALYFFRGIVRLGPDPAGRYVEGRQHLYRINSDGQGLRPVNIGAAATDVSPDGRQVLAAQMEVWLMQPDRPETLRALWQPPDGHLLIEARFAPSGYLALTQNRDRFSLWTLGPKGESREARVLPVGHEFAWSPSGRFLLIGGWDGLWWCQTGPVKPARITDEARGPIEAFGFLNGPGDRAFFRVNGQCCEVWPEGATIKVKAVAENDLAGRQFRAGPPQGGYAGELDYALPGPGGQVLAVGGGDLLLLAAASGRSRVVAHLTPSGRAAWSSDGNTAVFSAAGDIYRLAVSGSTVQRVASGFDPVLSQRGDRIAFWRAHGGLPQVFVQDLASGEIRMLTFLGGKSPAWIAQDRYVYVAWQNGQWQVALGRADTEPQMLSSLSFYTAQLASFPSYKEARLFADACAVFSGKWPVYIVTAEVSGTRWYRVRLGIFESPEASTKALAAIAADLKQVPSWDGQSFVTRAANEFGWLWPLPGGGGVVFEAMGAIYHINFGDHNTRVLWSPSVLSPKPSRELALSPDGQRVAFVDEQGRLLIIGLKDGKVNVALDTRPL